LWLILVDVVGFAGFNTFSESEISSGLSGAGSDGSAAAEFKNGKPWKSRVNPAAAHTLTFQQTLAFQIPSQATGNGVAELIEFAVGRGFNPAEAWKKLPLFSEIKRE
jgi:hypothetical protein